MIAWLFLACGPPTTEAGRPISAGAPPPTFETTWTDLTESPTFNAVDLLVVFDPEDPITGILIDTMESWLPPIGEAPVRVGLQASTIDGGLWWAEDPSPSQVATQLEAAAPGGSPEPLRASVDALLSDPTFVRPEAELVLIFATTAEANPAEVITTDEWIAWLAPDEPLVAVLAPDSADWIRVHAAFEGVSASALEDWPSALDAFADVQGI